MWICSGPALDGPLGGPQDGEGGGGGGRRRLTFGVLQRPTWSTHGPDVRRCRPPTDSRRRRHPDTRPSRGPRQIRPPDVAQFSLSGVLASPVRV